MSLDKAEEYRSLAESAQELLQEEYAKRPSDQQMAEAFHKQVLRYSVLASMEYLRSMASQEITGAIKPLVEIANDAWSKPLEGWNG